MLTPTLENVLDLDIQVITDPTGNTGGTAPCGTNDGCAGSCASSCASFI